MAVVAFVLVVVVVVVVVEDAGGTRNAEKNASGSRSDCCEDGLGTSVSLDCDDEASEEEDDDDLSGLARNEVKSLADALGESCCWDDEEEEEEAIVVVDVSDVVEVEGLPALPSISSSLMSST